MCHLLLEILHECDNILQPMYWMKPKQWFCGQGVNITTFRWEIPLSLRDPTFLHFGRNVPLFCYLKKICQIDLFIAHETSQARYIHEHFSMRRR